MSDDPQTVDSNAESSRRWPLSAKIAFASVIVFTITATIFVLWFLALAQSFLNHLGGL
jgi:hypothetical protein